MKLSRPSESTYARITVGALTALVVIIITGALVRLTGSGLGCTDWPTCNDNRVVAELELHPMIEFVNRVFTGFVSIAVILAVLGALIRRPRRRDLIVLSLSLVLGVIAQAVIGGLTVLNKLRPEWVMAHFLVSMLLIWAALVLVHRARNPYTAPIAVVRPGFILLGRAMAVLTAGAITVGTMVTGSGPHGGDADVKRLDFGLHDITKAHGVVVWLLIALTVFTLWRMQKAGVPAHLIRLGEYVVAAQLVQGCIGYIQYATHLPAWLLLIHVGGSVAVWLTTIWFNLAMFDRYEAVDLPVYDGDQYPGADLFGSGEPSTV